MWTGFKKIQDSKEFSVLDHQATNHNYFSSDDIKKTGYTLAFSI